MLASVSIILQTIFVVLILGAMVMLLLGITHLFNGAVDGSEEEADRLRDDVESNSDVITDDSLFNHFIASHKREEKEHRHSRNFR